MSKAKAKVTSLHLFNSLIIECYFQGSLLPSDLSEAHVASIFLKHSIQEARQFHKDYPGLLSPAIIPF